MTFQTFEKFVPTAAESRRYYSFHLPKMMKNRNGKEVPVSCPFQPKDHNPSMSVNLVKGTWFCHACNIGGGIFDFEKLLTGKSDPDCWDSIYSIIGRDNNNHRQPQPQAAPRSNGRRIVAIYDFRNANGTVRYQEVRWEPKGFSLRRPDGNGGWINNMDGVQRVPFNLPALSKANVALITEGSKDAEAAQKAAADFPQDGKIYVATTNSEGAAKWTDEHSQHLKGFDAACVFEDNDQAGRKRMQQVCPSVSQYVPAVYIVRFTDLPEHGDLTDYLRDHTPAELYAYMQAAPRWTPPVEDVRHENESEHGDAWEPPEPDPKRGTGTATASDDWPEPEELDEELPAVPPFDLELLPESLRGFVKDIAERMGCAIEFPAAAAIAALAAVTNRRAHIQPRVLDTKWTEEGNLWTILVGHPGTKKSPSSKPFRNIVRDIEKKWGETDAVYIKRLKRKQKLAKLQEQAWAETYKKDYKGRTEEDKQKQADADVDKMPDFEVPPLPIRRLLTSDVTPEKLQEMLRDNPGGLTLWRDEISGLIISFAREGWEGERPFLIECWSGGGHSSDRIIRGSTIADFLCVSIFGTSQPAMLKQLFEAEFANGVNGDGLLPRFQIVVYPDIRKKKAIDRAPDKVAEAAAVGVYTRIAGINVEQPKCFRYDTEAQKIFNSFESKLDDRLDSGDLAPVMLAHLSKYPKLVNTLALLLSLAEGETEFVRPRDINRAIAWCNLLEAHAVRFYARQLEPAMIAAIRLLKEIKKGTLGDEKGLFTVRTVYQRHWTDLDEPNSVRAALETLSGYGWVRKVDPKKVPNRPAEEWEISPLVEREAQ